MSGTEDVERDWWEWRRKLMEAWANDWRATMTALLEEGPPVKEVQMGQLGEMGKA